MAEKKDSAAPKKVVKVKTPKKVVKPFDPTVLDGMPEVMPPRRKGWS